MITCDGSGNGLSGNAFDDAGTRPALRSFGTSEWGGSPVKPPGPKGLSPLHNLAYLGCADRLYVVEDTTCADLLDRLGLVSTTSPHAAGSAHRTDWSPLAGKRVSILPKQGPAGTRYAEAVVNQLAKLNPQPEVRILQPATLGLRNDGDDVGKYIRAKKSQGMTKDALGDEIERLAFETAPVDLTQCDAADADDGGEPLERMSERDARSKDKPKAPTQAELLIELAGAATFFHTPDGESYATFRVSKSGDPGCSRDEHHKVRSAAFRLWLGHQFYLVHGTAQSSEAMQQAVAALAWIIHP